MLSSKTAVLVCFQIFLSHLCPSPFEGGGYMSPLCPHGGAAHAEEAGSCVTLAAALTLIGARLPTDVRKLLTAEHKQYLAANLPPNTNDAIISLIWRKIYYAISTSSHRVDISASLFCCLWATPDQRCADGILRIPAILTDTDRTRRRCEHRVFDLMYFGLKNLNKRNFRDIGLVISKQKSC